MLLSWINTMNAEEIRDRRPYRKYSQFLCNGDLYWNVEFDAVAGKFAV